MQITRLRLVGFKSFVEPTELLIERGLTGVVGPNGCGKSNLLEALRWVMGETSHKSMRAAAMDDVIFAGTNTRPARNVAEVTIILDNSERKAPVEFNDRDEIEITRRIEREAGSAYRINSVEARARDVKILFEDAATGARSPALVRQGQIGELVNAKPENRRRILEDAAGVAGLHSRRHEAELRLKAAEGNLQRMNDLKGSLVSQLDSLKRQARQARRYKDLSTEIRKAEALALHVAWRASNRDVEQEESALRQVLTALAAATEIEARALRDEAELSDAIQPLRDEEAVRAAVLARVKIALEAFEREAERSGARERELKSRRVELQADIAREEDMLEEAGHTLERLTAEQSTLDHDDGSQDAAEAEARDRLMSAETAAKSAEAALQAANTKAAEAKAERRRLEATRLDREEVVTKLKRQIERLGSDVRDARAKAPDATKLAELASTNHGLAERLSALEAATSDAEAEVRTLSAALKSARETAQRSRLDARALSTERETLAKLLLAPNPGGHALAVDHVTVAPGYEIALAAALGDDLDASLDDNAGIHWRHLDLAGHPQALPDGAEPLIAHVGAPPALEARLRQVGIVSRVEGHRLQSSLLPGQRLVSREGDLWRWDGFIAAAEGETPAARRLAERNRLDGLAKKATAAAASAETAAAHEAELSDALATAGARERELRAEWKETQAKLTAARDAMTGLERAARDTENRLSSLEDAKAAAEDDLIDAATKLEELVLTLDLADDAEDMADVTAATEAEARKARAEVTDARAAATELIRARQQRRERFATVRADLQRWEQRRTTATAQLEQLRARTEEIRSGLAEIADLPAKIAEQREKLLTEVAEVDRQRTAAADRFAAADTALKAAVQTLKAAVAEIGRQREARARLEARLEAARIRRADDIRRARETLDLDPQACLAVAEFDPGEDGEKLPPREDIERRVATLKLDREKLGGVNLEAEGDLDALETQLGSMAAEIDDVEQAIAKLRGAIGQLNREARQRLNEAFQIVNGHFQRLFSTLFGGGEARLELIENDDPLLGGLEIIAKPPGKKPATLSLLSGGEQTLTALSLIFAVFLTNPSPICVLDEVDAPLDDSNVDRFCLLMEKMAAETDTRFLVITHHPMTMARMSRLFGVTMAEKGISQLVSVDLQTAVRFQEAV